MHIRGFILLSSVSLFVAAVTAAPPPKLRFSLYCRAQRSTVSRAPTKFSRAAIPDRLYNYPVLSSSGERTGCSREAVSRAAEEAI